MRILHLDHDSGMLSKVKILLEENGIQVVSAGTMDEFEQNNSGGFDLYICEHTVRVYGDGLGQAILLQQDGETVMFLASSDVRARGSITFLHKYDFERNPDTLLTAVKSLTGM